MKHSKLDPPKRRSFTTTKASKVRNTQRCDIKTINRKTRESKEICMK